MDMMSYYWYNDGPHAAGTAAHKYSLVRYAIKNL